MPCLVAVVAVESAAPGFYSYSVPPELIDRVAVGQMAEVTLGRRRALGYIMRLERDGAQEYQGRLRPLGGLRREEPLFGPGLAKLIDFVSGYYLYPPGLCAKEILPGGLTPRLETALSLRKGAEAAGETPLIGAEAELLSRLNQGPQPVKALLREGFQSAIRKLKTRGLLEESVRSTGRELKPRYEWWLGPAAAPPPSPRRLGPKEEALHQLVGQGPTRPLSYYRSFIPDPLPQARSLAAKGLAVLTREELFRDDPQRALHLHRPAPEQLTEEQRAALNHLFPALNRLRYEGFLLFGVTGSGKTEVYLRSAERALAAGRQVLWLAPEIALTLGLEGQIKERLGEAGLAVLHSALSPGERHDQWVRIRRGEAGVVLGARSAVFAPLENLGLIIVDEEHDWAYKQDDGLRYHGRDLAAWRARQAGAALILGSATPSLESFQAAREGRLRLLRLTHRPGRAELPRVEFIDQRREQRPSPLSPRLAENLRATLSRGEQALLFINRRGLANIPMCLACGAVMRCPHCSVSLTLHGPVKVLADGEGAGPFDQEVLVCHHCGFRADPPATCPDCRSPLFRYLGVGTERLLKLVEEKFPEARGGRLDTDALRRKGGLSKILGAFARGDYNLLVGTQMAAKGHDFPNLTLVGVVEADQGLNLPDFRAAERTFQLLSQVSGRAGRADSPGLVLIQTRNPRHYALISAAAHDYEAFYREEIAVRDQLGYPPFTRLALIRLSGPDETALNLLAEQAGQKGRDLIAGRPGTALYGPAPSPLAKIKDLFRVQYMVQADTASARRSFLRAWLPELRQGLPADIRLTVDIDPYHLL